MKNILFLLASLNYTNLFSQEFPSDSIILKEVFGATDKGGKTFSSKYKGDENVPSYQDRVVYRIVFKSNYGNNLILAIVEAPYGTQEGHQFGYQDLYFIKLVGGKVELANSIKSGGLGPIGDESVFEIVDIGKDKKALVSTFQSTGNHHFERTKSMRLLESNKLKYLFSVHAEYSNACCKTTQTENESCEAISYEETYEIVKSNSDWFDIKVHHKDFRFTKGCKESYLSLESDKVYVYNGGNYIEKK